MGRRNHADRDFDGHREDHWQQHDGPGRGGRGGPGGAGGGGPWGRGWGHGPGGGARSGPPPWVAGLFGLDQGGEQRRGPRVRRGDVRSAILDVLHVAGEGEEQVNGYQVIQQIAERSNDAWRPSPGSVYPTIQQLEDEGLVAADDERGRKTLSLTEEGKAYVASHADELAAVWVPFERREQDRVEGRYADLKPEIGQMMSAVWQIVSMGSAEQKRAAVDVLVDTRRKLYGILADGETSADPEVTEK
jgi:DNA-binding PadR family transcriptional regulator